MYPVQCAQPDKKALMQCEGLQKSVLTTLETLFSSSNGLRRPYSLQLHACSRRQQHIWQGPTAVVHMAQPSDLHATSEPTREPVGLLQLHQEMLITFTAELP